MNTNTRITRPGGNEIMDGVKDVRYVRAVKTSYVNGVLLEPGEVGTWPVGVDKLGPNLEQYDPKSGNAFEPEPTIPPMTGMK